MEDNSLEVPKSELGDVGHIAATTIIGLIPFVGGAELFKAAVPPPIEKRRDNWMQAVAAAIQELQTKKSFDVEQLRDNEEFITLLIQTTQSAFRTHLVAKHALLKTALINALSLDASFDTKQLFVGMLDRFSPTHIAVLSLIDRTKLHTTDIHTGGQYYDKLKSFNETAILSIQKVPFLGFLEDLHKAGLVITSGDFTISDGNVHQMAVRLVVSGGKDGLQRINLTDLGYEFLHFIEA